MRFKYQTTIVPLTIILLLFFITPVSMAANEKAPSLQTQYAINGQKLYVSVLPSLNNYYGNISHTINSDSDYAKFVTPQAVEPIAESIQNITHNLPHSNEQFADAVLTFVHQIPYAICDPKYPVETLSERFWRLRGVVTSCGFDHAGRRFRCCFDSLHWNISRPHERWSLPAIYTDLSYSGNGTHRFCL